MVLIPTLISSLKSDANRWAVWCITRRTEEGGGIKARGSAAGSDGEEEEQGRGMGPGWVSAQGQ
jgi:hypothetical protein